jgi:hypothetical protein
MNDADDSLPIDAGGDVKDESDRIHFTRCLTESEESELWDNIVPFLLIPRQLLATLVARTSDCD